MSKINIILASNLLLQTHHNNAITLQVSCLSFFDVENVRFQSLLWKQKQLKHTSTLLLGIAFGVNMHQSCDQIRQTFEMAAFKGRQM